MNDYIDKGEVSSFDDGRGEGRKIRDQLPATNATPIEIKITPTQRSRVIFSFRISQAAKDRSTLSSPSRSSRHDLLTFRHHRELASLDHDELVRLFGHANFPRDVSFPSPVRVPTSDAGRNE